jgi:hypothetical protein
MSKADKGINMDFHLVVVRSFGGYAKGAVISAATEISAVLAGEFSHHVVRVTVKGG